MKSPSIFKQFRTNSAIVVFTVTGLALLMPYLLFPSPDDLDVRDIARIAEFQHLRQTLGETAWPGFGRAQIPIAMVKGEKEYLFDHPSPPGDSVSLRIPQYPGPVYYKKGRTLPRLAMTAIPIGGVPTTLMPSKATFDQVISMVESASEESILETAMSGDSGTNEAVYGLVAVHESFHAFQQKQGMNRIQDRFELPSGSLDEKLFETRLRETEAAHEIRYMLKTEIRHLAQALSAKSPIVCREEARLFLEARDARRQAASEKGEGLTVASIAAKENEIEWIEGMTNYVQSQVLESASTKTYKPLDLMAEVPRFQGYARIDASKMWNLDRSSEMSFRARSYIVGAKICSLLDRLGAEWKKPALENLIPPEELLKQALGNRTNEEQNGAWKTPSRGSY
jgi:hypothetical protein